MNAPTIELVDIYKSFGSALVLEGVSLVLLTGAVYHPQPGNDYPPD
jgi:hypothetical protein